MADSGAEAGLGGNDVDIIYPDSPATFKTVIQLTDINGVDLPVLTVKQNLLTDKPSIIASDYSLGFYNKSVQQFVVAMDSVEITQYMAYLTSSNWTVIFLYSKVETKSNN